LWGIGDIGGYQGSKYGKIPPSHVIWGEKYLKGKRKREKTQDKKEERKKGRKEKKRK
jgi:hypothetical protein